MATTIACVGSSGCRDEARAMPTTRLIYDRAHPFAIGLEVCSTAGHPVQWWFSRSLLYMGVADPRVTPVGQGDVRISVEVDEARVELSSPSGRIVLWLSAAAVREFLAVTFWEIPLGTEANHIDWDATTELLLEGRPRRAGARHRAERTTAPEAWDW